MDSRTPSGFTIIELMVVLVVAAIMATIALPNLREMVVRSQLKSAASDLHAGLLLARSEAIKRNASITVVPANAADWSQGWSVKSGTTVLSREDAVPNISFSTRDASYTAATVSSITFSGSGRETGSGGAGVAFVISSSQYPTSPARCVVLDPSGRPKVLMDNNNDPSDGCS